MQSLYQLLEESLSGLVQFTPDELGVGIHSTFGRIATVALSGKWGGSSHAFPWAVRRKTDGCALDVEARGRGCLRQLQLDFHLHIEPVYLLLKELSISGRCFRVKDI